jgi:hypothetical protein
MFCDLQLRCHLLLLSARHVLLIDTKPNSWMIYSKPNSHAAAHN